MAIDVGYDTVLGWIPATFPVLLANAQETYQANTTDNTDVDVGPAADMLRTFAGLLTDAYGDLEGAYGAGFVSFAPGTDVGVAEGSALELLLSPKIGPKLAAASSLVTLPLTALAGPAVNIPGGSRVRVQLQDVDWLIVAPVVIPGGGSIDAIFEYTATGPKQVINGSNWTISTPVTGWATAGPNALAAIPGRDVETDFEYRQRYRESLSDNLVRAVRQVDGVTAVKTIEHPSNVPDAFWGATHWVELVVTGGDDLAVATAIHGTLENSGRAKGVRSIGFITVVVADPDYIGGQWPESFSRPVPVQTFVEINVVQGEGYPSDNSAVAILARETALEDGVIAHYATLSAGNDTSGFKIARDAGDFVRGTIPGIDDLKTAVDFVAPPTNTGTLPASVRQQLVIARADIDIVGA